MWQDAKNPKTCDRGFIYTDEKIIALFIGWMKREDVTEEVLCRVLDRSFHYFIIMKTNFCPDLPDGRAVCVKADSLPSWISVERLHKENCLGVAQRNIHHSVTFKRSQSD